MSVRTIVESLPTCELCHKAEALFDGKTRIGPWAFMCLQCFGKFGIGLGTGKGQRMVLRSEVQDEVQDEDPTAGFNIPQDR